jgi:hypothetical protein
MTKLLTTCLLLIAGTANASLHKYHFPDVSLSSEKVCGEKYCHPGNHDGTVLYLWYLFTPIKMDDPTPKKIAATLIGKTYDADNQSGGTPLTCSGLSENPFTENDMQDLSNERIVDYNYERKITIDVNAAVKADMEMISKYVTDAKVLTDFNASLTAAYNAMNGKTISVSAVYNEVQLKNEAYDRLIKSVEYKDCREYITENHKRIIVTIGLISFNINYEQTNESQISADLQAKLNVYSVPISIGGSIKKKLTEKVDAKIKQGYAIVSWVSNDTDELNTQK